ncbi:MAG TPA: dihydroxyacetone kinase subunit DhaL [Aggregatilinea sp.]|uniref:dihydroxyacetone kinase subunit DhaL n=1 Tax=Aggregatilinea sp. TaxID=2806333 RepID=UPI002C936108|nr:dihydroxyacetone kinase subunit DhaL [Aggregatilinea sp.]HML20265.1 dihydroxyacetone kinase subunit DhaL [Aggregatilinea sp.]
MLLYLCQQMIGYTDTLTQADQAIGDGDHGIGMARGFEAVRQKLEAGSFTALDELFKTTGMTLITSIGGASGIIFGTWFRGGAKNLGGVAVLDAQGFSTWLVDGLAAVKERGKTKAGDKTMVDALEPAALKSAQVASAPLTEALAAAAEAARVGMEATKEMVASVGRAKSLGERSLGHPDPGAVSTYLILKTMYDFVAWANQSS